MPGGWVGVRCSGTRHRSPSGRRLASSTRPPVAFAGRRYSLSVPAVASVTSSHTHGSSTPTMLRSAKSSTSLGASHAVRTNSSPMNRAPLSMNRSRCTSLAVGRCVTSVLRFKMTKRKSELWDMFLERFSLAMRTSTVWRATIAAATIGRAALCRGCRSRRGRGSYS